MTSHNTIIQGDCIEGMSRLDTGSIDFVLTDPPYIIGYRGRDGRTVANDDNTRWLRPAFANLSRAETGVARCGIPARRSHRIEKELRVISALSKLRA